MTRERSEGGKWKGSFRTYGQFLAILRKRSNCVPNFPRAEGVGFNGVIVGLILAGRCDEFREMPAIRVIHLQFSGHGKQDMQLQIGSNGQRLAYSPGKLHDTGPFNRSIQHDVADAAEGSIRHLQIEHRATDMGNDRVLGAKIDPVAGEGDARRVGSFWSQGSVVRGEGRYQWQWTLIVGLFQVLRHHPCYTAVEVRGGDWSRHEVIAQIFGLSEDIISAGRA